MVVDDKSWQKKHPYTYNQGDEKILTSYTIDTLSKITDGEAVIVSDVGQHQMWVAQWYKFKHPRTHITSGGLGTMGFGFPAAMGAKFARPDKLVVSVCGDGSFQMNLQELATAVENRMDLKICSSTTATTAWSGSGRRCSSRATTRLRSSACCRIS